MNKVFSAFIIIQFLFLFPSVGLAQSAETAEFNSTALDNVSGFVGGSNVRFVGKLPSYLLLNPAIYNPLGVPLLELGYGGIIDTQKADAYSGHRASAWINLPLEAGQLNGGIEFQTLNTTLAATGTMARIHFGWANKILETFVFGAAIEAGLASGNPDPDWALSAKIGISQNLGTVGPFSEFTWNLALTSLGKELKTPGDTWYRSPFTPKIGISAAVNFSEEVQLHNAINLAVPGFIDLMLNLQTSLVLFKRLSISLAWGFDLTQLIDDRYQNASLLPRLSLSYSLLQHEHPDLDTTLSIYSPYADHVAFAAGVAFPLQRVDREGPEIQLSIPETIYMSPNDDGRQDNWSTTIEVDDISGVAQLGLRVMKNTEELFTQVWSVEPVREEGIYGVIQEVFQTVQTVVIPESILIGGKNNAGAILQDGSYDLEVYAIDILGNRSPAVESTLVVDTEPPQIEITELAVEEKIFSPNGDGNKDVLKINQGGSSEDLWTLEIYDVTGNVVRMETINDSSPALFEWDGHDNSGQRLADGVYQYRISSRDRAGNRNFGEVSNIIVNSIVSPVKLVVADSHFSPNNDGQKDSITFIPETESRSGIKQWRVEILDDREEAVTVLTDTGVPERRIAFDGYETTSENLLPEGRYRARLTLEYLSGNQPQALSPWFTLDISPPEVAIDIIIECESRARAIFSPNNDGQCDDLRISQNVDNSLPWSGTIISMADQQRIRQYSFTDRLEEFFWDGRDDRSMFVPDGAYQYEISASDEAGNTTELKSDIFFLDTAEAEILISRVFEGISPNGDTIQERQEFISRVTLNDQVQTYTLEISNDREQLIYSREENGAVPDVLYWNGQDVSGRPVPDGEYFARLQTQLFNGSVNEGRSRDFLVDTQYPVIEARTEYLLFSPNGDDKKDSLPVFQQSSEETLFSGTIYDSAGEIIRSYTWNNLLPPFEWYGRDQFDNLVPDGDYRYVVHSEDIAGNFTELEISEISLDSRSTSVFLTLNETGISPNNDNNKDQLGITLITNITDGIERWSLGIYEESGEQLWERSGNQLQPLTEYDFDGRNDEGEIVEGTFYAQFNVVYTKGDTPEARSTFFTVDTSGPELLADINPLPFSPDGDGLLDVLNIDLTVSDASELEAWNLSIYDRVDNLFQEFTSPGVPEEKIYWDGLSKTGERVISAEDYRYRFEASDVLGNSNFIEGVIPVDILVTCNQDKSECKIQIANITFEPNSPSLILGTDTEAGRQNEEIILRLVEILAKYSQYNILIAGHGNNISGTESEEEEELLPLSTGRAESVKAALLLKELDDERLSVTGRGGSEPLVSVSDSQNRWKNRRVEFILVK